MTYGTSSGKTSKISALDITESHCNCTLIGDPGCTIIPKQKSAKFLVILQHTLFLLKDQQQDFIQIQ